MRNFFINSLEQLVNLAVILGAISIVISAGVMLANPMGGVLPALGILIGGFIWLVLITGFIFLQIGIQANTRRTAEAVEALLARQGRAPDRH